MLQVVKKSYNTEEVPEDNSVPILKKGKQKDPTVSPLSKGINQVQELENSSEMKLIMINMDFTKNAVFQNRQSI